MSSSRDLNCSLKQRIITFCPRHFSTLLRVKHLLHTRLAFSCGYGTHLILQDINVIGSRSAKYSCHIDCEFSIITSPFTSLCIFVITIHFLGVLEKTIINNIL